MSIAPASRLFTSVFLLLLISTLLSPQTQAAIEKSPNDPKQYAALTLDNQLRVLLISDPDSDKAAASMNVAVGSSANPEGREGLAHFLEHMLFLGTEKYPEADEYQNFIRSHGGGHNAFTAQENTNYFFDIQADSLEPALDRFAQFFIAPLFNETYVDRERHAVHSEYRAKIRDDYRRAYAATKQVMNLENSHNRFSVGNLDTLSDRKSDKVRDDLIAFYEQHYSANLMTLVVLGTEPLAQLEAMVRSKFTAVKNHNRQPYQDPAPLFLTEPLPLQLNIQTVKDLRTLTLTFPIPETRSHWQAKPVYYISSLVGYEGKGSLLSYLKMRGWATSLSASQGHNLATDGSFMINIELTQQGLDHYLEVTQSLFQYIKLLQQEGITPELYTEEKQLSNIAFRFQEQSEPIHLVSQLSNQMQYYPTEQVIVADYKLEQFDADLINAYLERINPENMLLTLKTHQPPAQDGNSKIEQYYRVPYQVSALSAEQMNALRVTQIDPALQIRSRNPFIPENLELIAATSAEQTKPQLLIDQPGFTLWHQTDTSFGIPQANLYFTVQTPYANATAENWVHNKLYTDMLQEQLNETLYEAYLAGLSTQIYPHLKGFSVRLSGYNDKIDLLLDSVLAAIRTPDFNPERFQILKQQYADELANAIKDKPYNQTTNRLYELLMPQHDNASKQAALNHVSLQSLQQFAAQLLSAPSIKVLAHGNIEASKARELGSHLSSALVQSQSSELPPLGIAQIPEGITLAERLHINHNDSAISLLLQGENNALRTRAELSVLSELLASPFYNEIRTEKQLGYIVFASPLQMNKTPGLAFIIQSPVASADQLEQQIDQFLQAWETQLPALDQASLERYKASVLGRITQRDNKLSTRTNRYWRQLDWGETGFDGRERLAAEVEKLTLTDLQDCFSAINKRRLVISSDGLPFVRAVESAAKGAEKNVAKQTSQNTALLFAKLKAEEQFVPES